VLSTLTLNSFYYLVEHYFDPNKEDTAGAIPSLVESGGTAPPS